VTTIGNQGTNYVTLAPGRYAVSDATPVFETIEAGSPVAHNLEPGIVFEADGDPEEVPGDVKMLVYRVRSCLDGADAEGHVSVEASGEKLRPWRRHHKVICETPLTPGAASDGSEPLRKLQADELVDLLDLPALEQATGSLRARCIALGETTIGWATIREAGSGDAQRLLNLEPVPAPPPAPVSEPPAPWQQDAGAELFDNGDLQQSESAAMQDPTPEEVQFNIVRPPPPPGRGSSSTSEQTEGSGGQGRVPAVPPPPPPRQGRSRPDEWTEDKGKGRSGDRMDKGKGRHDDYFDKGKGRPDHWHKGGGGGGGGRYGDYHDKGKGRQDDWGKGRSRMDGRFDKGKGWQQDDRGKGSRKGKGKTIRADRAR